MTKKLRLSFILAMAAACVMIAWSTLANFFNGVGVNFVALLVITGILTYLVFTDRYIKSRFIDIFILMALFTILEFIVYIVFEFGIDRVNTIRFSFGFQNFLSIMGIIFLAYTAFRFATEYRDVRISFIELILGNGNRVKRVKTNKELVNGSLEEKPNHKRHDVDEEKSVEAGDVIETEHSEE